MRLTNYLLRQHIDFMFKKHWLVQGKRVPIESGVQEKLKKLGIKVEDANEFIKEEEKLPDVEVIGMYDEPLCEDATHPDFKERPCYTINSNRVLLEGIDQAQVITKTVISEGRLPDRVEEMSQLEVPEMIHENMKKAILSACVFDPEQKKLPIVTDPNRLGFTGPRIYGITDVKKNLVLTSKLLQLIERSSDTEQTLSKYVSEDVNSHVTFEKESELIQFQERSNILVSSLKPLRHEVSKRDNLKEIPELYPVKHTVTLEEKHFYDEFSLYPIKSTAAKRHPHTTWLHYNRTQVSTEYELEVTHQQELGRALVHTFTLAAAYAKQLYGEDVKDLPEPVHMNCIQSDGQKFHLGVLELNTLNVDGKEGTKNVWHMKNDIPLYGRCQYVGSIPTLEAYNTKVFGYINALYNS